MRCFTKWLTMFGGVLLAGVLGGCATAPETPLFVDAAAWPSGAGSVALVGVSFDEAYRPLPQSGLDHELLGYVRRELQAKGYAVVEPESLPRLERKSLLSAMAAELLAKMPVPADLVVAVHVDFLFSSATYGEANPRPEFEIAAEARVVDGRTGRDLWRGRGHALTGGAGAMFVSNPNYDRMTGLAELAKSLFLTLPDAGLRPGMPAVE